MEKQPLTRAMGLRNIDQDRTGQGWTGQGGKRGEGARGYLLDIESGAGAIHICIQAECIPIARVVCRLHKVVRRAICKCMSRSSIVAS